MAHPGRQAECSFPRKQSQVSLHVTREHPALQFSFLIYETELGVTGQALIWESAHLRARPGFVEVLGKSPSSLGLSFSFSRMKEMGQVVSKNLPSLTSLKREPITAVATCTRLTEPTPGSQAPRAPGLAVGSSCTPSQCSRYGWPGPLQGCRLPAPASGTGQERRRKGHQSSRGLTAEE